MFRSPGSLGIFLIGAVGAFFFTRFFERDQKMTAPQFAGLLTLIGLGAPALALIQGYLRLNLLDPYGLGLVVGAAADLILRGLGYGFHYYLSSKRPAAPAPAAPTEPAKPGEPVRPPAPAIVAPSPAQAALANMLAWGFTDALITLSSSGGGPSGERPAETMTFERTGGKRVITPPP